jgi:hypothetical protein
MASKKIDFATQCQTHATTLAQVSDALSDIETVYFDRGYNSGGGDELVDGDITALEITAANIGSLITLAQQLRNFVDNAAVTQGDYDSTLNVLRTDL